MDLGQDKMVTGTVIQPRRDAGQYVTKYSVAISLDGKSWTSVSGVYDGHSKETKENLFLNKARFRARYVRLIVNSWSGHLSLRCDVLVSTGKVPPAKLIISRANTPENKRTYSSIWSNDKIGTGHARSMINSPQGWSAQHNKAGQWMQMDLGKQELVAGTVIQPRRDAGQYVTSYTVSTSVDGKSWSNVPGVYKGHSKETWDNEFTNGVLVRARYVRLIVGSWSGHLSLRAEVLVANGKVTPVKEIIVRAGVPENKRTYSSIWSNEKIGTGHARSTINSPQGWSAQHNKANQWMQMDLGQPQLVAGTVIQPRADAGQYVTKYTISTSLDGKSWTAQPGEYIGNSKDIMENRFSNGARVHARYVRLYVKSWNSHISLRADTLIDVGKVAPVEEKIVRAGVAENKRTYSSIWSNDKIGTGHARSMIDSPQGWSAQHNKAGQWVQMDLGQQRLVA